MSYLTTKYNENEMKQMLSELLYADEYTEAALYCTYKETGFFANNRHIIPGYVALTDKNRLIGYRMSLFSTQPVLMELQYLTKIKISNTLFGQKIVYMVFNNVKKYDVKFQISPKILGANFPEQEYNMEKMLDILRSGQNMLQ